MTKAAAAFDSAEFLRRLTEAEASALKLGSRRRLFSRGDVVFWEGDDAGEVMVLRAGRVKVCGRRSGREVIMSILDPGALLGEVSAVDGSPRSATVIALERVEIDAIPLERFHEFLETHPRVSADLLRLLVARLRQSSDRLLEFGTTDTLTRLCGTLARAAERYGRAVEERVEIAVPLNQQELAEWSGMSREAFVKGLHQLRSVGWLSVEERTIVLLDPAAIRDRARLD